MKHTVLFSERTKAQLTCEQLSVRWRPGTSAVGHQQGSYTQWQKNTWIEILLANLYTQHTVFSQSYRYCIFIQKVRNICNRGAYVDNMLQFGNINIRKGENKHGFINCVNAASGAHVESPKTANINQILKRGNY